MQLPHTTKYGQVVLKVDLNPTPSTKGMFPPHPGQHIYRQFYLSEYYVVYSLFYCCGNNCLARNLFVSEVSLGEIYIKLILGNYSNFLK